MAETLKASKAGLQLVYTAIRKKGWTKTQTTYWWEQAQTSQATLRRFWRGIAIERYSFQQICTVAGVDWETVVTKEAIPVEIKSPPEIEPTEPMQSSRSSLSQTCRILSLMLLESQQPKNYSPLP